MNTIANQQNNRFRILVFNMLLIFILGIAGTVYAQKTSPKNRLYKTWIKKTNSKTRLVGVLYQVEDGKLQISENNFDHQVIYAHEIDKIKLRKQGSIGRGVMIGILSGFATGVLIGLMSGNDPPCARPPRNSGFGGALGYAVCSSFRMSAGEKALGAGVSLGLVGGIVGAVVGSLQIKIPINGSSEKFKANKIRLKGYSYKGAL